MRPLPSSIMFVDNWFEEFEARTPTP